MNPCGHSGVVAYDALYPDRNRGIVRCGVCGDPVDKRHEEADRRLAADLRECAASSAVSIPRRVLAVALAAAVDRWVAAGRSGARIPELVVYGNHGGVGWGGAQAPVDPLDACFRAHDRAYDALGDLPGGPV